MMKISIFQLRWAESSGVDINPIIDLCVITILNWFEMIKVEKEAHSFFFSNIKS